MARDCGCFQTGGVVRRRWSASRPLHVLLVHVWYWPHVGGGDQHVEQIGRELVRRGHKVTVWCADVPSHDEKRFNRGGSKSSASPLRGSWEA